MALYKRNIKSLALGTGIITLFLAGSLDAVLAADDSPKFEKDRAAILAMAGNYKVNFYFDETVSLHDGYEIRQEAYTAEASEVVKVIEESDDFISLQHILVVKTEEGIFPVKHWRQDWIFEPDRILEYKGHKQWAVRALDSAEAEGKWVQAIYQVDDSPRYSSLGKWKHEAGTSSWTSMLTWRPLPRREYTSRDDYDVLVAVNRHTITPTGWVHEQDNSKLVLRDGENFYLAREIGVNRYDKFDDPDFAIANDYWQQTRDFWQVVRAYWDAQSKPAKQITIKSRTGDKVLWEQVDALSKQISAGEIDIKTAIAGLPAIFDAFVRTDLAQNLSERGPNN